MLKNTFKALLFVVLSLSTSISLADRQQRFPTGPNLEMTPGDVCHHADEYRYPEKIAYCVRNVDSQLKKEIIREYDQDFGYSIQQMDRMKFKIDHFIPLCMGGSNDKSNLWPQHESVYKITDPLEPAMCNKMAEGKLLQAEAIDLIKYAKQHLDEVPRILREIESR